MDRLNEIFKTCESDEYNIDEFKIADEEYFNCLFEKIKNGEPIDLSYTYFNGFPLDKYRKKNNINKTDIIRIKIDNAMFAVFDSSVNRVDFSWVEFEANDDIAGIAFNNSIFYGNEIDFSYSLFNGVDLCFDECFFVDTKLLLVYCSGIKNLSFIKAKKTNTEFTLVGTEIYEDLCFSGLISKHTHDNKSSLIWLEKNTFKNSSIIFEGNEFDNLNDFVIFVDNKFDLKTFSIRGSNFKWLVFYSCYFDSKVEILDCNIEYFIIQSCIMRDVFKIKHEETPLHSNTKFCFLDTIFNGYFDMDNIIDNNFLKNQKKLVINDYDSYGGQYCNVHFIFDDTSYLEKSIQTNNLSEIYSANGKSKQQDKTYSLYRRYKNIYRVEEELYCIKSIKLMNDFSLIKKTGLYLRFSLSLIVSFILFLIEFILFDVICGNYATNPIKFFISLVGIIFGFAFAINLNFDLSSLELSVAIPEGMGDFLKSLLISTTNFFQIDLLDKINNLGLYVISLVEKILGIIVLAMFSVSYTRKIIK